MKRLYLFLLLSLIVEAASAQVKDTLRVLAIGNSFSEDAVEQYLWDLGKEAGVTFIIGNAYRGGWSLIGHWNDARSLAVNTEYRKVTDGKKVNLGKHTLRDIITDEPWDVITLQQVSQDAGRLESYEPGLSLQHRPTSAESPVGRSPPPTLSHSLSSDLVPAHNSPGDQHPDSPVAG